MLDGTFIPNEMSDDGDKTRNNESIPAQTPQDNKVNEDVREPDSVAWEEARAGEAAVMEPVRAAFDAMPRIEEIEQSLSQEDLSDVNAGEARRIMIEIIKSKPNLEKESFSDDVKTHIDYLEALAKERGGADQYVWLWYQSLVSYDQFAIEKPEFDPEYQKSLEMTHYFIDQLPDSESELAAKWRKRLSAEQHN